MIKRFLAQPGIRWVLMALISAVLCLSARGEPLQLKNAQIAPGRVSPTGVADAAWKWIELDDAWRREVPCRQGEWTYRVNFQISPSPLLEPHGLLIHRAGNRLHIWLNGTRIARYGELDQPDADYSNAPLYIPLPTDTLRTGSNLLLLQLAGDCRRYSGLSQLEIAPQGELEPRWRKTFNLITWQNAAIASICALLALISLGIGLWRRNAQALMFSVANGTWSLRCMLWGMTELPMSYELWFFFIDFTYGIWMLTTCLLAMQLANVEIRWLRIVCWLSLALFSLSCIATALGGATAWKAFGLRLSIITCIAALISIIHKAWRKPNANNLSVGAAGAFMIGLALIDHWNIWVSTAPDAYHRLYLSPVAVMAFILSLGLILARRFDTALKSETRYRRTLEKEVSRQKQALEASYKAAEGQIRQEAIEHERQRIVREMHDGLGAQLVGILSAVRNPHAQGVNLAQEVEEALEQLHSAIDTMTGEEGDLTTTLAQFRFRLENRIRQAGLRLHWHVTPLPEENWPPQALMHFERILREVFTNILKHASASEVCIDAGYDSKNCHIRISDNGCGFDPALQNIGRGTRHLKERAKELGISLTFHSAPGQGTRVELAWPPRFNEKS